VPLLAQIISTSTSRRAETERPYRGARPCEEAFQVLADEAVKGWRDRVLVDAFVDTVAATT
jgi:response regulator RpfG family c-di-GMP phosphodiesterase